jgi:hypothetical protein
LEREAQIKLEQDTTIAQQVSMDLYGIEQANQLAYEQYVLALLNNLEEVIVVSNEDDNV